MKCYKPTRRLENILSLSQPVNIIMTDVHTINSKINGTAKGVYLRISKLHSILVITNLLPHNNITINYYMQVNSLWLKLNVASKWASKYLWGTIYFAVD